MGVVGNANCEIIDRQSVKGLSGGAIDAMTTKNPDNAFNTTFGISVAMSADSLVAAVGANTASVFECAADEIVEVTELSDNTDQLCERLIFPLCADFEEDEQPEDCVEEQSDGPVFRALVNAGAVYMYSRESAVSSWELASVIRAPVQSEDDNFGWSVDLSDDGSVVAVGAPGEDSESAARPRNNKEESAGAVYVFRRNDDADDWLNEAFLKAGSPQANDLLGWAVELSGDGALLAGSAIQRSACRGSVFVYAQESDVWTQQQTLTAPTRNFNDVFGFSLSMDYLGATLAVGANQFPDTRLVPGCLPDESGRDNLPGEAHVFVRSGSEWEHSATVTASNAENGDRFGNSVSLNSNAAGNGIATRLLVGAPLESSAATGLNGNQGNQNLSIGSGAAYLFEKQGESNWEQTQYIKASNTGATDQFGNTVRLASGGSILAIGAWGESGIGVGIDPIQEFDRAPASGAVYIFQEDVSPGLWTQMAYVKPPFIQLYGAFGWSLSISDSSRAMLVGAPGFVAPGVPVPGSAYFY